MQRFTSYQLPVTSCKLQVISYKLQAKLQATSLPSNALVLAAVDTREDLFRTAFQVGVSRGSR